MNLAKLRQRVERMRERYQQLRPKESPPALVIKFCCEINPNAPEGTKAAPDDGLDDLPDTFAMIPPGCRDVPQDVMTFDEWLKVAKEKKNGS